MGLRQSRALDLPARESNSPFMEMNYTCHSETGRIRTLFIKTILQAFTEDDHIDRWWRELNFSGRPDLPHAVAEYEFFEDLLRTSVENIFYFYADQAVNMDSVYCRDASIATDGGMILCRMGKPARQCEPAAQKKIFERQGIRVLGSIQEPGTLEGGDVAWLDEKTLSVGHGYRTNLEGIRQLGDLVRPLGVDIIVVSLPHYKGPEDVFHLMSIFSPVDKDLAVVYSPLMPVAFRNELLNRNYRLVEVSADEFESMGSNVLALAPGHCVITKGNPQTRDALRKAGCQVSEYPGAEISAKGGGGPTCLTRPIDRYLE